VKVNVLDRFQRLAASIIDMVEYAIRKVHPEIDKIASDCEGNTLLHGESYYTLEDKVSNFLRERLKE